MEKQEFTLNEIIERHQHYINHDVDGWEDMRADLYGEDLSCADLRGVNLQKADLRWAYLGRANLIGANLQYANLQDAFLYSADLEGANLYGANLYNTHMKNANLKGANLKNSKLIGALFDYAKIDDAIFDEKEEFRKGITLSQSIIGWKKCVGNIIVELEIPKGAKVFCINGDKCRTNKAKVVSISYGNIAESFYDISFTYEVGKEIEIKDFNPNYNVECGSGIHFFKNKEDAKFY